ncbi:MAG: PQQ-like beta-propeller repeat protein [Bacteroidia bacterium]|nr:PQQ-like beta-propeller repeat protein [Bacteroidia bacterium]
MESVPGMDKPLPGVDNVQSENVKIGESFQRFSDETSGLKNTWNCFRGANHDNILKTDIHINEDWKTKKPKIAWSADMGEGYAAASVYAGFVYVLDYDEKLKADALRCLSLTTGKEIWRRWYKVRMKKNHGVSRTIPAVTDKYIVTLGPRCHVMCLDRPTGNLLWTLNLEKEFNTEAPFWYTGQCPLIDNDVAVIAPGGKSLMIGIDCKTGKQLWETPNKRNLKMSHSSIIPMTIEGKRMYVYGAIGGLAGISAEGDDAGKILWEFSSSAPSVVAPSAVYLNKGKILFTAGYGAGSAVIRIGKKNDTFEATLVQKLTPSTGIASEQQTPVFYNGLLYCILPKDAGALHNQFVCYNPDDCSKPVWSSGKTKRFGLGPYLVINDKFLILNDDGELTLIKASSTGYSQIAQVKIIDGQDAWGPMAFADGYLIIRDLKKMYGIDLR